MKYLRPKILLPAILIAAAVAIIAPSVRAGGPLLTFNGQPTLWARGEVRGGALNSATVDAAGRVLYRVDTGMLGTLTEAQATAIVDHIFDLYTGIPTASIEFVNAGRIIDPTTGQAVDVNGSNVGRFLSTGNPTFQNPIIFDSDGAITGDPLVLGFFGFLQIDDPSNTLREGVVVINGRALSAPANLSATSLLGVFTHEFGHFAGPLDHAQINGHFADRFARSSLQPLPPGFTQAQAYDLFGPFTETLYPFIFDAPAGSMLGAQFPDSGFFIATLDLDTQNALSALYPTPDFAATTGSIEGRVIVRTPSGDIPVPGINVVARRIDQGAYPPAAGTQAFTVPPALDAFGVPETPQPQAATDPLATVSSAVTSVNFGEGRYRIDGLPPGNYLVEIQQINPDALDGSGIGPLARGEQYILPVQENFSGPRESGLAGDTATDFEPVAVAAGQVTTGIDIILNGFSDAPLMAFTESGGNHKKAKATRIGLLSDVTGAAASTDSGKLKMDLGNAGTDKIEDLYRFTVTNSTRVYIFLDPTSGTGDLDLYLFLSGVNKKKSNLNDPNLIGASLGLTAKEQISMQFSLAPGDYFIGVSAFEGNANYRLRVITVQ
ncbi:MAG: PPC domain-containing protein [Acidobacteriota bacterium]